LERPEGPARIELSQAQVDQIMRDAPGAGNLSSLLRKLEEDQGLLTDLAQLDFRYLSRSLLMGMLVLAAFPADGSYAKNAEVAARLNLNTSTAHRYVATLAALGLLVRDPGTRRYRRAP
jgi:DNA-binding MarR family transcriptional regulator